MSKLAAAALLALASVTAGCSSTSEDPVACTLGGDCPKTSADSCLAAFCEKNVCVYRAGADRKLPDPTPRDCTTPACVGGHVTMVTDPKDLPDDLRDCRVPDCSVPDGYRLAPEGTPCASGSLPVCITPLCASCQAGVCKYVSR